MDWRDTEVAPEGTHHTIGGKSLYHNRFGSVLKFHAPGLAPVQVGGEAWHIDLRGEDAYDLRFCRTFGFYEGRAAVIAGAGWHHILPDGKALYSERYGWCGNFQGGRCAVRDKAGAYLHLLLSGAPAYERRWAYAGDYRDGVAVAQGEDGLSTHIDLQGAPLHGRGFLDLDVFHKGFARARDDDGWTHVDTKGKPLYHKRFSMVEPFYNGQARVETFEGALWIIDERGERLTELRSPRVSAFHGLSADLVGYWKTQSISAGVALGLFEALPGTLSTISFACELPPENTLRLLRAMESLSLVELDDDLWRATARGVLLQSNHPLTLADAALEYGGPLSKAWRNLPEALQDPKTTGVFREVAKKRSRLNGHHRMLSSYAKVDYGPWIDSLPIHPGERVFDAGGGQGTLARLIKARFPESEVIVGDLPEVIEGVTGVSGVKGVGMDLFERWPIEADVILMARVLHDWPDADALAILKRAREALSPGGRLLCLELVRDEGDSSAALCDLHLLAVTGGQERTQREWLILLATAGLALMDVTQKRGSIVSLLVGESFE